MKISKARVKDFVFFFIIMVNILTYVVINKKFGNIAILKYGIMVVTIAYYAIFYKIKIKSVKKPTIIVLSMMILQFFILPLVVYIYQGVIESVSFSVISIIYILFCWVLASYLQEEFRFNRYIKVFYMITIIYILISFIQNPASLNLSDIKNNLFGIDKRLTRQMYGFVAPNSFAILCVTNIILGFYLNLEVHRHNKIKKSIVNMLNVFCIILIITTASRGAILSLSIFFLIFYYKKILEKRISKVFVKVVNFLLILTIIVFIIKFLNIGFNYSKLSSGRIGNWNEVTRTLIGNNKILFGFGYVNYNTFYNNGITSTLLTDNWIIHTLATQGIIGMVLGIILIIVIFIFMYIYKPIKYDNKYNFMFSFTVLMITYSFIENMFFSVNYILSLFYWINIFWYLINVKNKYYRRG